MTTLEQQRASTLAAAQKILDDAKAVGRALTDAERADVRRKIDDAERLLQQQRVAADDEDRKEDAYWRQQLGRALAEPMSRLPGSTGVFSAKSAAAGLVTKIAESMHG